MNSEDATAIFVLLGLAAVAFLLVNSSSQPAALTASGNVLMHNSEEYEWVDYRGRTRTLTVRRQVERG